jgi:molybdopterin-guanine dinucleotide biosynthesis protein A
VQYAVVRANNIFQKLQQRDGLDEAALLADAAVAALDPDLDSLLNLNDPDDYEAARARPAPLVAVDGHGALRAATLGASGSGPATVNGRPCSDPQEPLVAGDVVRFDGVSMPVQ